MYAIAGNHDMVMRKGAIPPQVIFKRLGLKVISPINTNYTHGDIFIAGLPYYPSSQVRVLKSKLADLSKKAADYEKSILVLHQGIDKYFGHNYELEIGEIPDNFDYYAMGHIHNYVNDSFGRGRLVYPGSTEIWKTNEVKDYNENGKGFVLVDFSGQKIHTKRVKIDASREFISRSLEYDSLESGIAGIKELIQNFDKKPILNLQINNVESDTGMVYEMINEELSEFALMIRPKFNMADEPIGPDIENDATIGPEELITEQLKHYDCDELNQFGLDLYDFLSKDKIDESRDLVEQFFSEFYDKSKKYEKAPQEELEEVQETLDGVLK